MNSDIAVSEFWHNEATDADAESPATGPASDAITDALEIAQSAGPSPSLGQPEITARRTVATGYGDLAAIIKMQSTELERLAHDNDRLVERLEHSLQLYEIEQRLRLDLQEQVQSLREVPQVPAPAVDAQQLRREARESVVAEIKPILSAMLEMLELAFQKPDGHPETTEAHPPALEQAPQATAVTASPVSAAHEPGDGPATKEPAEIPDPAMPTGSTAPAKVPDTANAAAEAEAHPASPGSLRLPEILTRPLEELTVRVGDQPKGHRERKDPPKSTTANHPASAPSWTIGRTDRGGKSPGVFTWTNLFA